LPNARNDAVPFCSYAYTTFNAVPKWCHRVSNLGVLELSRDGGLAIE
jgi:hypothetical protein